MFFEAACVSQQAPGLQKHFPQFSSISDYLPAPNPCQTTAICKETGEHGRETIAGSCPTFG